MMRRMTSPRVYHLLQHFVINSIRLSLKVCLAVMTLKLMRSNTMPYSMFSDLPSCIKLRIRNELAQLRLFCLPRSWICLPQLSSNRHSHVSSVRPWCINGTLRHSNFSPMSRTMFPDFPCCGHLRLWNELGLWLFYLPQVWICLQYLSKNDRPNDSGRYRDNNDGLCNADVAWLRFSSKHLTVEIWNSKGQLNNYLVHIIGQWLYYHFCKVQVGRHKLECSE